MKRVLSSCKPWATNVVLDVLDPKSFNYSSLVPEIRFEFVEADDRIRTGDVQLGKLTFYH